VTTKEEVIKLIKNLPENVTLEDIMRELYVRSKIEKGIQELNVGKVVSHDEVKGKLEKWLN
jgi:predicted transcriptional regulator